MKNKLLTVLSDAEQFALYGLPDFDDRQRLTYLSLSGPELALASSRPSLHAQVWCALQIGYFKAKHAFFRFSWDDAQQDGLDPTVVSPGAISIRRSVQRGEAGDCREPDRASSDGRLEVWLPRPRVCRPAG
jgi:hypothetical protein